MLLIPTHLSEQSVNKLTNTEHQLLFFKQVTLDFLSIPGELDNDQPFYIDFHPDKLDIAVLSNSHTVYNIIQYTCNTKALLVIFLFHDLLPCDLYIFLITL